MNERQDRKPVLLSVMDRLLDDDPDRTKELPPGTTELHRKIREAIRRDVESFFNTRKRCVPIPEGYRELSGSLLDYGVPDLIGRNLSSANRRRQFLRELESLLRAHDRRFKSVKITATGDAKGDDRALRFRIDVLMHAEPAPETIIFDSRIEPVSKAFEVKG